MPKIKVLDTFNIPVPKYDLLRELGTISVFTDHPETADIAAKRGKGADIIVLNKAEITDVVLNRLEGLTLICEAASGYDNIDIKAAGIRGIPVCNVPGYSTDSVAELVFAHILATARKIPAGYEEVKRGGWLCEEVMGEDIAGKTIGVVGFGKIGRAVCSIAKAFSMNIMVYTKNPDKYRKDFPHITFGGLEEVMQTADIVTLHVPHNEETDMLINKEVLTLMKPGALLVNTSRGKVIDEKALTEVLKEGNIRACLDVMAMEPPGKGNELFTLDNVLITPHVGWYTDQAIDRLMQAVYDNINGFLLGRPRNVVNGEYLKK